MLHAVIMAGGSGTRFWPESILDRPKQFLNLFGNETMLQTTVNRINPLIPPERVWVITNARYVEMVKEQLPDVPEHNILGEPVAKNTAPCVAAASALIAKQDKDATMAVLPADHIIAEPEPFLAILEVAAHKAQQPDALVTIGIQPNRPETGYGYIEFEKASDEVIDERHVKRVVQFREKPNITKARQFIYSGHFLWNSGMFIWKASTILQQFEKHLPEIAQQVETMESNLGSEQQTEAIEAFYKACPSVSIDYGIMEHAQNVFVIPGSFGWNDVGSWKALYDLSDKNEEDNVLQSAQTATEKAEGNFVHSQSGKIIALVGVKNLAVVETDDAILVCDLDHAQGVKQIVNQLKESDNTKEFL